MTGDRKAFFTSFAPYSTQWQLKTDRQWSGYNPLEQAVQIARFFEGVQESPPQILIRTTGYTFRNQNLGTFSTSKTEVEGTTVKQTVSNIETTTVPVDLAVAALDEDQAEYLIHFIEMATGPMARFLVNYLLRPSDPKRRNWAVTLPLSWAQGGMTDVPLGEDRKNRLWTATLTSDVQVEVATAAQYETPFTAKLKEIPPSSPNVAITVPSQVHVGSSTPLYVNNRPADSAWRLDNCQLARITPSESLYAKRVGSVTVSLISQIPGHDSYASQQVQIVP